VRGWNEREVVKHRRRGPSARIAPELWSYGVNVESEHRRETQTAECGTHVRLARVGVVSGSGARAIAQYRTRHKMFSTSIEHSSPAKSWTANRYGVNP
jgi:hypothetical protein